VSEGFVVLELLEVESTGLNVEGIGPGTADLSADGKKLVFEKQTKVLSQVPGSIILRRFGTRVARTGLPTLSPALQKRDVLRVSGSRPLQQGDLLQAQKIRLGGNAKDERTHLRCGCIFSQHCGGNRKVE
jgi:hypothetical protein